MDLLPVLTSLLFFVGAFFVYKRSAFSIVHSLIFVVLTFVTVALDLLYEISDYFTGSGITDATIYSIQYGLDGAGFGDYKEIIYGSILLIIGIIVLLGWILLKVYHNRNGKMLYSYTALSFLAIALLFSPAIPDLYDIYASSAKETLFATHSTKSSSTYNFYDFYREPKIKQTGERKNLVFIYGEGLEETFSNEETFPGLTPGLDSLEKRSTFFTNLQQPFRAGYTIAGIAASQCGISLVSSHGNSISGMDAYLPDATCLGDLLKDEGYHLAYYGGANLTFAGKGDFLKTHGFDEMHGQQELLPTVQPSSYKTSWGLYDDSLFSASYNRFLELSQDQEPFALFMLTLDTHQSDPHPSKSCKKISYEDGSSPMLNAVACSDYLITNFVNQIIASPYGKNTVIVIASDHLALNNSAIDLLEKDERKNRLMIISPDVTTSNEIKKLGSTLDIGTTTLPFIGYQGDIGLGRNLLGPQQSESEIEVIQNNIPDWIEQLSSFWNFPKIEDAVQVDIPKKMIAINGREFKIPILIELSPKLQTNLIFQIDTFELPDTITDTPLIDRRDIATPFLLIDECKEIQETGSTQSDVTYCLAAGNGPEYSVTPLTDTYTLTVQEIMHLTGLAP